ncbi:hypothetical protein RHGRI_012475 [Rhododendron griersonianum]|uniref:Uncharacterized protein n=1 Tax=Rhododendron griersonianum TaxID=479676 RepID=A0AAV6KR89_9ERIC|nr:hypothetical protein RHGRI_012475 [Rhododendron griersonianum]
MGFFLGNPSGEGFESPLPALAGSCMTSGLSPGVRVSPISVKQRVDLIEILEKATIPSIDFPLLSESNSSAERQIKQLRAEIVMLREELRMKGLSNPNLASPGFAAPSPSNGKLPPPVSWKDVVASDSPLFPRMNLRYCPPSIVNDKLCVTIPEGVDVPGVDKWKDWVVGYFVDRKLPFTAVQSIAKNIWRKFGIAEAVPVGPTQQVWVAKPAPQVDKSSSMLAHVVPFSKHPGPARIAIQPGDPLIVGVSPEMVRDQLVGSSEVVALKNKAVSGGPVVVQAVGLSPRSGGTNKGSSSGTKIGENMFSILQQSLVGDDTDVVDDFGLELNTLPSEEEFVAGLHQEVLAVLIVVACKPVDGSIEFVLSIVYGHNNPVDRRLLWNDMRSIAVSIDEDDDDNDVRLVLKLGFLMRRVGNDNERFELRREREERESFVVVVVGVLVGVVDLIKATVVVG